METCQGRVFDVARFCLDDGPGIRTTVFLKGCPLRCAWCHNPESQRAEPEILFSAERCTGCGACAAACPRRCHAVGEGHGFDRARCAGCGACARACPAGALRLAGRLCTAREVFTEVLADKAYYETSGGGLTVSGGEPAAQPGFVAALFGLARAEGIHTCVETCGEAPGEVFEKLLPLTDLFLYDWKMSNPEAHRRFTGTDNRRIRENLLFLDRHGAAIVLRLPLIPGYNDVPEHFEGVKALVRECPRIGRIEIMPYHPLGVAKARELGRAPDPDPPRLPAETYLRETARDLSQSLGIPAEVRR